MTALPEDQPIAGLPDVPTSEYERDCEAAGLPIVPDEPPVELAPLAAGTFAIYEDGKGGYVLVTDMPGSGVQRKHIPAALVKLATGGGMLSRKLGGIFG